MTFSRRQLVRVAATGAATGLAGCGGLVGDGVDDPDSIEAEVTFQHGFNREGIQLIVATWTVNQHASYVSVDVENTTSGDSVETALCGVGASLTLNGRGPGVDTNGPVGDPPNCESGSPSALQFAPGDEMEAVVTAHTAGGTTKTLVDEAFTFPTPTPSPTPES
jgi:hypothetical protein